MISVSPIISGMRKSASPTRLLLVPDDPNSVSALRRLLRASGYEVFCADNAEAGLALLQIEQVDAIISDAGLPGMSGAEFLKRSRLSAPNALRVMLTGQSDVELAVSAINDGEIFSYVAKSWDNEILLTVLHEGLERKLIERKCDLLRAVIEENNGRLRQANDVLKTSVLERTRQLGSFLIEQKLVGDWHELDEAKVVQMLFTLIKGSAGLTAGCPPAVARIVGLLGAKLGLAGESLHDLCTAAMLQDLGKLGLPARVVDQPLRALASGDILQIQQHPIIGGKSLMTLTNLKGAGAVLANSNEDFDGNGMPGVCKGNVIPLAARILRVATDFEHYLAGAIDIGPPTREESFRRIRIFGGKRYDPVVVEGFFDLMNKPLAGPIRRTMICSHSLRPGMEISLDLHNTAGDLLLNRGLTLTHHIIAQIRDAEKIAGDFLWITVNIKDGDEIGSGRE